MTPSPPAAVIPVSGGAAMETAGFLVSRDAGITPIGKIAHSANANGLSAIRRDSVYTVSSLGVMTSQLSDLAEKSFMEFPGAP